MNKKIKLVSLLIISLSVFFIYNKTNNSHIKILNMGDGISQGINSYGIKDYSHIDYYKDYLKGKNIIVEVNNDYSKKDMSLIELLDKVKNNSKIKSYLYEAHLLFITIGYNDLLYRINIEENMSDNKLSIILLDISNNYNNLIQEIRKYYKKDIYIIGYPSINKNDYYLNKGIKELNKVLESNKEIRYIDTYNILNNRLLYFSNPNSIYPNQKGYYELFNEIKKYA